MKSTLTKEREHRAFQAAVEKALGRNTKPENMRALMAAAETFGRC